MTCEFFCCFYCFFICWFTKVLQWNAINRHRYIASIVFRLYLVRNTSYHSLRIIKMTQPILLKVKPLECFLLCVTTVISSQNAYVWKVRYELFNFWKIETCVEISNRRFYHNKIFSGVQFCRCHSIRILKTQKTFPTPIYWAPSMHCKPCNEVINMKMY